MSIALGNKKPEQLLEVERLVWRALFTLSEGMTAPEDVLNDLLLQIPWQRLQPSSLTISQQDSEWFTIKATPLSAALAQNTLPAPLNSLTSTSLPLPVSTPSPLRDDNAMDETPDHQLLPPTLNVPQAMDPESRAPGIGFGALNEGSPSDDPISGMNEDTPGDDPISASNKGTPSDDPISGMNEDTPGDDPISATGEIEDAPTSRRSARLALEKSKEVSLHPETLENLSRSTSLVGLLPLKPNQHHPTTARKRKAPTGVVEVTGEVGVTNLSSAGCSCASPIDVDALHAVLERYPLKREPQV